MISKRQTIALFANRTSRVFPPSLFNLPPFRHKDNNFFNLDAFLLRLKSPEMKDWRANGTEDGIKFLMLLPRTHKDKDAFIGHLNDVIGAGVPESCRNCENCKDIVCKQTIRHLKACFEETDRVVERAKLPGVGVDFGKIIEEIVDAEENMLRALSGLIDESLAASECEVPSVPEKTDEHKIQLVAKKTKLEREYKAASACLRAAEKTYDAAKTASKKACEMHAAAKLNSEKANENVARASATKKGGALSKEAEKLQKKTDGLIVIMQTAQAALDDAKQAVSDAKKKEADAKNEFELSEMDIESYATLSARSQESDGGSSLSSSLGLSGRRLSSEPCAFADACVQYKRIVDKAFVSTSAFISNDVYHQEHSMLAIASLELNMVLLALHRISFDGDEDTAIKLNSNTSTEVDDLVQLSVSNRARFVTLAYERINAYAAVYQSCVERDIYAELILVTMGTLKTKADLMLAIGEEYRKSGFLVNFDELEECPLFTKKFVNWKKMEDVRDSMFPLFSFQDWVTCEQFAPIISKVVGSLELIVSDVSRIETAHC